MVWLALLSLISAPASRAEATRCEKLRAEAAELKAMQPVACEESRETHQTYVKAFPEVFELCRKLEAEVQAGPARLKLGTEEEMHSEIMELKQRHLSERRDFAERITRELLPTALDNNDPSRLPPKVSSECGTEIEAHVRYRRSVLRGINEFYGKLDQYDDTLFQQAAERALPPPERKPAENRVR